MDIASPTLQTFTNCIDQNSPISLACLNLLVLTNRLTLKRFCFQFSLRPISIPKKILTIALRSISDGLLLRLTFCLDICFSNKEQSLITG